MPNLLFLLLDTNADSLGQHKPIQETDYSDNINVVYVVLPRYHAMLTC